MVQGHHYAAPRVTQRKEPRREEQKPEILGSCAPGTPCVYFWTLNYEGRSDVTGPPLCSSKGDTMEGAAQGGAKTLQYREVVPPDTLRVYFWTLKLKSESIYIGDFRPNVKRVMQR